MKTKTVNILLSSYNGEKYIEEQINSLASQEDCSLRLLLRDDGSTDSTVSKVQKLNHVKTEIIKGENIGVVNSFFQLLVHSYDDCEFYAFCDQDDFWHKDKLSRALNMLKSSNNVPSMYFSRLNVVNDKLEFMNMSMIPKHINFENALINNVVTGCTIVLNEKARDLLINKLPQSALMHDWWVYLVLISHGKVYYDALSFIDYRQHSNNVVGMKNNFRTFIHKMFNFIKNYNSTKLRVYDQLIEFRRLYGNTLKNEDLKYLNTFIDSRKSLYKRIMFVFKGKISRNTFIETISFSIQYLLGKY